MATKKKVPFSSIIYDEKFNHRDIAEPFVEELVTSILSDGLMDEIECAEITVVGDDGASEHRYKIVDGGHRFAALKRIEEQSSEAFAKLAPNGKLEVKIANGDYDALRDRSVKHNTYRKQLEPWEIYAEIVRRTVLGQDQREIAAVLRIQQPRVAEYLSFQKVVAHGHELWRAGAIANADMVKLASLDDDAQEAMLAPFADAHALKSEDAKAAKSAKATARKNLKQEAKEKGQKREYVNAGKPTRAKLASYVPEVITRARIPTQ